MGQALKRVGWILRWPVFLVTIIMFLAIANKNSLNLNLPPALHCVTPATPPLCYKSGRPPFSGDTTWFSLEKLCTWMNIANEIYTQETHFYYICILFLNIILALQNIICLKPLLHSFSLLGKVCLLWFARYIRCYEVFVSQGGDEGRGLLASLTKEVANNKEEIVKTASNALNLNVGFGNHSSSENPLRLSHRPSRQRQCPRCLGCLAKEKVGRSAKTSSEMHWGWQISFNSQLAQSPWREPDRRRGEGIGGGALLKGWVRQHKITPDAIHWVLWPQLMQGGHRVVQVHGCGWLQVWKTWGPGERSEGGV